MSPVDSLVLPKKRAKRPCRSLTGVEGSSHGPAQKGAATSQLDTLASWRSSGSRKEKLIATHCWRVSESSCTPLSLLCSAATALCCCCCCYFRASCHADRQGCHRLIFPRPSPLLRQRQLLATPESHSCPAAPAECHCCAPESVLLAAPVHARATRHQGSPTEASSLEGCSPAPPMRIAGTASHRIARLLPPPRSIRVYCARTRTLRPEAALSVRDVGAK